MGRYQVKCNTSPCRHSHIGSFGTPEEAAQAYLQHWEKEHPEELKKERVPRPVLLPVQEHLLIQSDRSSTGYKGVSSNKGRYKARCETPPCCLNYLGSFNNPEEAAQAYLQHHQHSHNHQAAPPPCPKDEGRHGWLRMFNALHEKEHEHLFIRSDRSSTGYKGVQANTGRYQTRCDTPPCRRNHLGSFVTPEAAAQAYLQHWEKEHPEELKKKQAPPLQVQEHLLIQSNKSQTGYKGVHPNRGRYHARCDTPPCNHNHLGAHLRHPRGGSPGVPAAPPAQPLSPAGTHRHLVSVR
jgi:hypothetical protein